MANAKITALTSMTTAVSADVLAIVDDPAGSPLTQKITYANLIASFASIGQLPFPATQSASAGANTLDDYEEGTWSPDLSFTTPGNLSTAFSTRSGSYTKIGRVVIFSFILTSSTFNHTTASGALKITGLPFSQIATFQGSGTVAMRGYTKANFTQTTLETSGSTFFYVVASGSAQTATELATGDVPSGGTIQMWGSGFYEV